jgi:hypothetical protein
MIYHKSIQTEAYFHSKRINDFIKSPKSSSYYHYKKLRKNARKKLSPIKYTHDMDDNLFNNVCEMICSKDRRDKVMALEIILNSKMKQKYIDYFINNHLILILEGVKEEDDEHICRLWNPYNK